MQRKPTCLSHFFASWSISIPPVRLTAHRPNNEPDHRDKTQNNETQCQHTEHKVLIERHLRHTHVQPRSADTTDDLDHRIRQHDIHKQNDELADHQHQPIMNNIAHTSHIIPC